VAACLALSSCFLTPHRIDVQQGNYLDTEAIAKLKPGMTRSQVRFLLGTPLLTDAFHPDRWDYLYIDRRKGRLVQEHRLTLWFEGDQLKRAVTDTAEPKAAGAAPATQGKQSAVRTP
jgi:outer membrane protein assembly factor BamE